MPLLAAGMCTWPFSLAEVSPVSYLRSQRFQQACYQGSKSHRVGMLIAYQGLQPAQGIHAQVPLLVQCQALLDFLDLLLHLLVSAVRSGCKSTQGLELGVAYSAILPLPSPACKPEAYAIPTARQRQARTHAEHRRLIPPERDTTASPGAQRAVGSEMADPACLQHVQVGHHSSPVLYRSPRTACARRSLVLLAWQ